MRTRLRRSPFPSTSCPAIRSALAPSIWLPGEGQVAWGGGDLETLPRWLGVTAQRLRVSSCPGSPSYPLIPQDCGTGSYFKRSPIFSTPYTSSQNKQTSSHSFSKPRADQHVEAESKVKKVPSLGLQVLQLHSNNHAQPRNTPESFPIGYSFGSSLGLGSKSRKDKEGLLSASYHL